MARAASTLAPWPDCLTDPALQEKIASAKVLAVGAGGIGCELIKTLVLTGFRNIETIDLDTIETSNLNRQFLFRHHHVGQSKAAVAADVVRTFAPPGVSLTAHQANVKEARFGPDYFSAFDLVLNGLDNMDARRHVNRLCVAAGTPLVESGTAGYLGQVTVHVKGESECYECAPKAAPKSYPVCTLRNTPDKPIHCVVWAKDMLFARLFGAADAANDLDDDATAQGEGKEGEDAAAVAAAAAAAAEEERSFFARRDAEPALDYARRVFGRVFADDVERLAALPDLWKARAPPRPLRLDDLLPPGESAGADDAAAVSAAVSANGGGAARALNLPDQRVWTDAEAARVFVAATAAFLDARAADVGAAIFDKDDALAVDFVTAAANLRSSCYGIAPQSAFDAKGMAGNIIHAIATTNAVISGLVAAEAVKLLAGPAAAASRRTSYLKEAAERGGRARAPVTLLLACEPPPPPRPRCIVCGRAQLKLALDTRATTLGALVSKVLKARLALAAPTVMAGDFMYEEGEGLEDDEVEAYRKLLALPLDQLPGGGIKHGAVLEVADQGQALELKLLVSHQERGSFGEEGAEGGEGDFFVLEGAVPEARPDDEPAAEAAEEAAAAAAAPEADGRKRARAGEEEEEGSGGVKRSKQEGGGGGGGGAVDLVSDDDGGAGGGDGGVVTID